LKEGAGGGMKAILDDLNDVPGVNGAFVCDAEGSFLACSMKAPLAQDLLDAVAKSLSRTAEGVRTLQGKGSPDIEMVFESGVLLLKPLDPGCLCILCVPKVNIPLLNLTANMAVRQLKKAIAGGAAGAPAASGA